MVSNNWTPMQKADRPAGFPSPRQHMRMSPLLIHARSGCVVCGGPTIPAARRSGVTSHSSAFCTSTSRRASKPRSRAGLPRDLDFFVNNKKNSKKQRTTVPEIINKTNRMKKHTKCVPKYSGKKY